MTSRLLGVWQKGLNKWNKNKVEGLKGGKVEKFVKFPSVIYKLCEL